jgi:hypothetical protein
MIISFVPPIDFYEQQGMGIRALMIWNFRQPVSSARIETISY